MLCDDTITDVNPVHLSTVPGMAFWAGSGPYGKTCAECIFKNYERGIRNDAGLVLRGTSSKGCRKFYLLTCNHGPAISGSLQCCKYFEPKRA
jgi:hypothetical protein